MEYKLSRELDINFSDVDNNLNLSIVRACEIIQDTVTQFFKKYDFENEIIKNRNNAVLVVLRHKISINKMPHYNLKIEALTYTTKKSSYLFQIESAYYDSNHNLLFSCKSEVCPIDYSKRTLRSLDSIGYPKDMNLNESINKDSFKKICDRFEDANYKYSQIVYSQDIDYSNHMNNIVYIRLLLNTLPTTFLNNIEIKDIEINYIKEAVELDKLDIFRIDLENEFVFLIKKEDIEIARARMKYEYKN